MIRDLGVFIYLLGWVGSLSPRIIPESPTCPMNNFPLFMKHIDAVVPAVEGRPVAVLRQFGNSFHIACWVDKKPSRMALRTESSSSDQKSLFFVIASIKCSYKYMKHATYRNSFLSICVIIFQATNLFRVSLFRIPLNIGLLHAHHVHRKFQRMHTRDLFRRWFADMLH